VPAIRVREHLGASEAPGRRAFTPCKESRERLRDDDEPTGHGEGQRPLPARAERRAWCALGEHRGSHTGSQAGWGHRTFVDLEGTLPRDELTHTREATAKVLLDLASVFGFEGHEVVAR
jgi:hypothetical protein